MPKETFFNLPQEKQNRIIESAMKEFAEKGYQKASVQAIAETASVAKGSIYQYFENKKELFFYIFDLAGEMKIRLFAESIKETPDMSFFELLEKMFDFGIRFAIQHPELYRIYQYIRHGAPQEIQQEFYDKFEEIGHKHYRGIIRKAIDAREIRTDIDEELSAFVVYILLKNFGDFLMQGDIASLEKKSKKYVQQCIEIIKNGIQA